MWWVMEDNVVHELMCPLMLMEDIVVVDGIYVGVDISVDAEGSDEVVDEYYCNGGLCRYMYGGSTNGGVHTCMGSVR